MPLHRDHLRLLAATVAVGSGVGVASAQSIGFAAGGCASPGVPTLFGGCAATNQGSYGPALFAPNKDMSRRFSAHEPYCATKTYPISDWAFIRKYCGPTIIPGSCYGHFETKWRKWEDHCPGNGGLDCAPTPGGVTNQAPIAQPITPAPADPMATPATPMKPSGTQLETPMTPNQVDPVAPPKIPAIPKSAKAMPIVPVPMPMPMVDTTPKELGRVNIETTPASPSEPTRVVIPPLPDTPSRK